MLALARDEGMPFWKWDTTYWLVAVKWKPHISLNRCLCIFVKMGTPTGFGWPKMTYKYSQTKLGSQMALYVFFGAVTEGTILGTIFVFIKHRIRYRWMFQEKSTLFYVRFRFFYISKSFFVLDGIESLLVINKCEYIYRHTTTSHFFTIGNDLYQHWMCDCR